MSKTNETLPVDEREALIPWYVSGKLSDEDRARVDAYLAEHPDAMIQLDLVGEEIDAALLANEAIDPPSARMFDRLMADVDKISGPARQQAGLFQRAMQALTGFLPDAAPMGLRAAAIAAALLIAVQAGSIFWLTRPVSQPGSGFEVASSGEQATGGLRAMVSFQDGATAAQISEFLQGIDAQIVEGPKAGGIFVLGFKKSDMSEADYRAAIASLQTKTDIVKFAAEAK